MKYKNIIPYIDLTIIGESINDSIPSTKKLFDSNDIEGIKKLAKIQDENGSAYIDVNIGRRTPAFMAEMIKQVQNATSKPLAIDTPDYEIAEVGLETYDINRANGRIPILNSISPLRLKMITLCKIKPFIPILMATERVENGNSIQNKTGEETYLTAKYLVKEMRKSGFNFQNNFIIDPGIAPIASDMEGNLKRVLEAMKLIYEDHDLKGVHISVGLSNFTVMLPKRCADGMPVKSILESAFITMAMPVGLDTIVGSVKRQYELLPENHPAMVCLKDILQLTGIDAIMRIKKFYS